MKVSSRSALFCACTVLAFASTRAAADTITHFGDGAGGALVPGILNSTGIGAGNTGAETTATTFIVPGAPATSTTLTFTFQADFGGYLFNFGFYDRNAVTADPVTDTLNYATQAITNGSLVFDDNVHDAGQTASFSVAAGTELGFFLIPNNTRANFLASPASFYPEPLGEPFNFRTTRAPLFSDTLANPGQFDQLLSFVGNGVTLFTWEDIARTGASDDSFADLAFTIDVQLTPRPPSGTPVPLPASLWMGASLLGGLGAFRMLRRRANQSA